MRKTSSLIIPLLLCLGISCTQNEAPENDVHYLTNLVLNSDKLAAIHVDISKLDLSKSILETSQSGKPLLIFPYKIKGKENMVVTLFDRSKKLLVTADVHGSMDAVASGSNYKTEPAAPPTPPDDGNLMPTNVTPDPGGSINAAYQAGTFNGHVGFTASTYFNLDYSFHLSRTIGATTTTIGTNGQRCNGWTETGGPLDCAGKNLTSQGPISAALCYIDFIPCFAGLVLDCMISGCNS